ncbi:MAG: hypothetical protein F4118_10590 [Acidimicrobiaceae bacterium]|nr:hypothetical protein [Candidatus Poribacteria bacterium]MYI36857.1 hypothetical protein [Acidimicrobiaceae bacterium]
MKRNTIARRFALSDWAFTVKLPGRADTVFVQRRLLNFIAAHADSFSLGDDPAKAQCFWSLRRMALILDVGVRRLERATKALQSNGYIERYKQGKRTYLEILPVHVLHACKGAEVERRQLRGKVSKPVGQYSTSTSTPNDSTPTNCAPRIEGRELEQKESLTQGNDAGDKTVRVRLVNYEGDKVDKECGGCGLVSKDLIPCNFEGANPELLYCMNCQYSLLTGVPLPNAPRKAQPVTRNYGTFKQGELFGEFGRQD